jgi:hypothetical protein
MSLTPEQIEKMVDEWAPIMENPIPWIDLSPKQEECSRWLMPNPSFTDDQRFWLGKWVLPVTPEQVSDLNALMPPHNVIAPREAEDGSLWVNSDLLSDALDGGRLSALLPILETLPLTYAPGIVWPVIEMEEA